MRQRTWSLLAAGATNRWQTITLTNTDFIINWAWRKNFSEIRGGEWSLPIMLAIITSTNAGFILRLPFNSSPPSTAYMRQGTWSTLVQEMAGRLVGAKPLPEPMMNYCQLDHWEHISVKFESEYTISQSWNVFQNVVCKMAAILLSNLNRLRPGQHGGQFVDGTFYSIFHLNTFRKSMA